MQHPEHARMGFILWLVAGLVYVVVLILFGIRTWEKGHLILFFVGFVVPILWILGAVLRPTRRAVSAAVPSRR